jgi:hypothetical protein
MSNSFNRRSLLNGLLAAAGGVTWVQGKPPVSTTAQSIGLANSLIAPGPHPSLGPHADTFGRLIGSWSGEYRDQDPGEPVETGSMQVHFGWVLEGRAVQDVWIAPVRALRGNRVGKRQTYGTTIRVFDPKIEGWRAIWLNPATGVRNELIGHRVGNDIVQFLVGEDQPEKWVFSEITPQSFLWRALRLSEDGLSWRLDTEFRLRRTT